MRSQLALVLAAAAGVAFAGAGPHGGGPGGHHGGPSRSGTHRSGHSSFSFRFGAGSYSYGSSGGYYDAGQGVYHCPGRSGAYYFDGPYGGFTIYKGWVPYSPSLYRPAPGAYWRGIGPFSYIDAVVLRDTSPVQAYGYGPRVADAGDWDSPAVERPAAPAPAAPPPPAAAPAATERAVAALLDKADNYFVQGNFELAVALYREVARKAPSDPVAALALGHGLFAIGAYTEAALVLRRGVRLYPDVLRVRMNRRDFYADGAAFDEQLRRLEKRVEASPADAAARFVLGYNYFFSGERAKAVEQFSALGPRDSEAQLFLREARQGE